MSIATQKLSIVKIILNKSMFDENIINIILQYYWNILDGKKKILLNWININDLNWCILSKNSNAIELLKDNYNKISWSNLSINPNAIELLKENQHKIDWFQLSENPSIFEIEHMPM